MILSPLVFALVSGQHAQLEPPVMSIREIGPATEITGGKTYPITSAGSTATLFIPDSYKPGTASDLWLHFHTADWFIIQEYQRADYQVPILNFNLGQGSSIYGRPFTEKGTLQPFLSQVSNLLKSKPASLNFTSFSAGYGAVRNLIQDPEILDQLRTVILCDSIYASLDPAVTDRRQVLPAHVEVWRPLLDRALKNKTTVIFTTSEITPETYAGSYEVVGALAKAVGGEMTPPASSLAASKEKTYPLLRTYQNSGLYIWSYEGDDAMAHMTHPRHLAEILGQLKTKAAGQ